MNYQEGTVNVIGDHHIVKIPVDFRFEDIESIDYYCPGIEGLVETKEKLRQKLFAFGFVFAVIFC